MAAQQAKRTLIIQPTEKDNLQLQKRLAAINKDRFNGKLTVSARWDYPSAVEPRDPSDELKLLPPEEQAQVAKAIQAYAEKDFKRAKELLLPFCHYELRQINGLYTSALRHLKEPIWFNTCLLYTSPSPRDS